MASQMLSSLLALALWFSHCAAQSQNANSTFNTTITWYGTNDKNGSPNCNSNTVACDFYTFVRTSPLPPPPQKKKKNIP